MEQREKEIRIQEEAQKQLQARFVNTGNLLVFISCYFMKYSSAVFHFDLISQSHEKFDHAK